MRKVSSKTTYFRKKILPIIALISLIVIIVCKIAFDIETMGFTLIFFSSILFLFVWIFRFRRLSEVYLDEPFFIVDNKKININKIVSIKNISVLNYKITYKDGDNENSFFFMIDFLPYTDPNYIEDIKKKINQKNK